MKYDENKCVLRPDLNDSKDLALRTLEGRAFQRTGAHVVHAFSPNAHLTLRLLLGQCIEVHIYCLPPNMGFCLLLLASNYTLISINSQRIIDKFLTISFNIFNPQGVQFDSHCHKFKRLQIPGLELVKYYFARHTM